MSAAELSQPATPCTPVLAASDSTCSELSVFDEHIAPERAMSTRSFADSPDTVIKVETIEPKQMLCWGAQLMRHKSLQCEQFKLPTGSRTKKHSFKDKFCESCLHKDLCVPINRVRALPEKEEQSFMNERASGLWTQKKIVSGFYSCRVVNNRARDSIRPMLVVFQEEPDVRFGNDVPEEWCNNGFVHFKVSNGTLEPKLKLHVKRDAVCKELWVPQQSAIKNTMTQALHGTWFLNTVPADGISTEGVDISSSLGIVKAFPVTMFAQGGIPSYDRLSTKRTVDELYYANHHQHPTSRFWPVIKDQHAIFSHGSAYEP